MGEKERFSLPPGTIIRRSVEEGNNSGLLSFDAFIIHGKNWRCYPLKVRIRNLIDRILYSTDPLPLKPSKDTRITAMASGIVWSAFNEMGHPPVLIFSTGKTRGENHPSEAEEMVKYMKRWFPQIPDKYIKLEDRSFDTPGNILESKKIIEENGFENVGYLTVDYHVPRVHVLMGQLDSPIQVVFPSDQWVKKWAREKGYRHLEKWIEEYTHSREWKNHRVGEGLLIAEAQVDPGQRVLGKVLTRFIRHQ